MDPGSLTSPALPWSYLAYGLLGLALLWPATRLLDQLWLRPRRLERALCGQGLHGTRYRFLTGDAIDNGRQNKEAWAKPLPLGCHDIGARVMPFLHSAVREHGAPCVSWLGPVPKVTITDPRLVREVMSGGHVQKLKFPMLAKLFALGLGSYEGEKWVKHRRILKPAFHAEKLESSLADGCTPLAPTARGRWTSAPSSRPSPEMSSHRPHSAALISREEEFFSCSLSRWCGSRRPFTS